MSELMTPVVETCERCKERKPCRFYGTPADVDRDRPQNGEWLCDGCVGPRGDELDAACKSMHNILNNPPPDPVAPRRYGDAWRYSLAGGRAVAERAVREAGYVIKKGFQLWRADGTKCVGASSNGYYWIDHEVIVALQEAK